jgi:hypothetical protein
MGVVLKRTENRMKLLGKSRTIFSPIKALKVIAFLAFIRARNLDVRNFVQPKASL